MMNTKIIAAKLLKLAGDITPSKGVSYTGEDVLTEPTTPISILQDNTDEMVALLQALPAKSDIKESIKQFTDSAADVPRMLVQIAAQLRKLLQPGSDSKEIAKIKATSGLNDLVTMLETYSKDFSDLNDLASLLGSTSSKHTEKDKHKPIKHMLRRKEELKVPKPDLKSEEAISLDDLNSSET